MKFHITIYITTTLREIVEILLSEMNQFYIVQK